VAQKVGKVWDEVKYCPQAYRSKKPASLADRLLAAGQIIAVTSHHMVGFAYV